MTQIMKSNSRRELVLSFVSQFEYTGLATQYVSHRFAALVSHGSSFLSRDFKPHPRSLKSESAC